MTPPAPDGDLPSTQPPDPAVNPVIADASVRPMQRQQINLMATAFSGPLPPPEMLAEYNRISPGLAQRMMDQVELQAAHRREIEKIVVTGNTQDSRLGIISAALVALACLTVAGYAVRRGQTTVAITIASGTIGSLVGIFVYGTRAAKKELARNASAAHPAAAPKR